MHQLTEAQKAFIKQAFLRYYNGEEDILNITDFNSYVAGFIHGSSGVEGSSELLKEARKLMREWEFEDTLNEREAQIM